MARAAPLQSSPKAASDRATPVQKKLSVGPARDRYEAEADRIADRVAARGADAAPAAPPAISRLHASALQRVPSGETEEIKDEDGKALGSPVAQCAPAKAASAPNLAKRKEVKTAKVKDEEEDKSTAVQRSADGPAAAPAAAEHSIGRMRAAGGRPMPGHVQRQMESGMGRSLSGVRIHDGAGAANAANSVGARAFTVGNDVFFGAGHYRPETPGGQRLLAHELVHTQQQKGLGNMAQTKALQRETVEPDKKPAATPDPNAAAPVLKFEKPGDPSTRIELNPSGEGGTIYLPKLEVPVMLGGFKGATGKHAAHGVPAAADLVMDPAKPFIYSGKTERKKTPTAEFQKREYYKAAETQLEPTLKDKLPSQVENWDKAPDISKPPDKKRRYYLRVKKFGAATTTTIIFGTPEELADHKRIKIPNWDRDGKAARFDVDHAQELQLGGLDGWENFWLLDSKANQDAGRKINQNLQKDVDAAITQANTKKFWEGANASRKPAFRDFKDPKNAWKVVFGGFGDLKIANQGGPYWTREEILAGEHLKHLIVLTEPELAREGFLMDGAKVKRVSVFTSPAGGHRKTFNVNKDGVPKPKGNKKKGFFGGFDLDSVVVNEVENAAPMITALNGTMFRRKKGKAINPTPMTGENALKVVPGEGLGFSGYLDQADFMNKLKAIPKPEIAGASPITFENAGINENGDIVATGYVTATKALFPALNFPIYIVGNDIFIEFPIPTEKLNFGPVSVTEAALRLGVGDGGVFVEGMAALSVNQLGSGTVEARLDRGNTIISGKFKFDTDFLDPASADIIYHYGKDTLTLKLNAGVGAGKLPGVKSGQFTATFSRDAVSFSGSMVLGGALSGVLVSASYTKEGGLKLGADNIKLPVDKIPGVTSATASLYARRNPESGEWSFGGAGTAVLGIAGATGTINISVDGDRIFFSGNLAVAKGPASGSLAFIATNAPIDEDGKPIEGQVTNAYTVFGKGSAEITFGKILKGTAGIELTPQANIIIKGTIGLPPTFEVFAKQEYTKSLLKVKTPDFPIWGVSLGGVGIGIFAFADAQLTFNAFVGPGKLIDTKIGAEMDLDKPADAKITGLAKFTVPAYAGFNLDIGGGLRARIAVAYVEGRVGLDAELGIAATASAAVDVAWNRTDGLSVAAKAEANAQPKFRVGVNASVKAGVDLYLTELSKTWGPWRKTLGEFGPNMSMGVTIPVKWNEKTGMDFSLDDIAIRKPEFNVKDILKSSFEELV